VDDMLPVLPARRRVGRFCSELEAAAEAINDGEGDWRDRTRDDSSGAVTVRKARPYMRSGRGAKTVGGKDVFEDVEAVELFSDAEVAMAMIDGRYRPQSKGGYNSLKEA
jgi:hypothetical protein